MTLLDGTDLDSALRSLGTSAGIDPADLAAAITAYDESQLEPGENDSSAWSIVRLIFARLGVDAEAVAFDGVRCFHGTRALEPASFVTRGIVPLDQMLDELWAALYELAADDRTAPEWQSFRASVDSGAGGHWGSLYRLKKGHDVGPHFRFVREMLLNPLQMFVDYLGEGSETVADIAACYSAAYGESLAERLRQATTPCIVAFDWDHVGREAVESVFWLAFEMLREGQAGFNANGGDTLDGKPVAPVQISYVEVCEPVPGRERAYRAVRRIGRGT